MILDYLTPLVFVKLGHWNGKIMANLRCSTQRYLLRENASVRVLTKTCPLPLMPVAGVHEIGDVVCQFLRSDFMTGHNIIAVGHSASVSAWY